MTTNNHPAHGPVSLDRLHQIREILSKAAEQSDGGNLGYAMADAVKVIDGAIAAFGAEPVADVVAWSSPNEERTCDIRLRRHDIAPGPLYTTPPAPVVQPVMFIDGDISASDAEKLAAVIREMGRRTSDCSKARTVTLPDVEKWRSVDAVRAQNAYKVLVSKVLAAAGIGVKGD